MRRFASGVLVAGLALAGAGCGATVKTVVVQGPQRSGVSRLGATAPKGIRVGPGPFILNGGSTTGGESGLLGDGGEGPQGTSIGCLNGRRYTDALGIQNSTKVPLKVIAASGENPDPRVVQRYAIQLRLSPPYHPSEGAPADLVYRRWSAKPTRPVTIPPGRIATVQRNILLRNCLALVGGRRVTIPGSLVLRYRRPGHGGRQKLTIPGERLVVARGPTRHKCDPLAGSASLVAADVSCAFARHAAPGCRPMKNGGWLDCTVDGTLWDCGRFAGAGFPLLETCYLPHEKSHWFSVVWIGRGLGLWGSIQNRRANRGWRRLDAWRATRGLCEVHGRLRTLVFESSALRVLRGKAIARVVSDARVKLVVRDYRGPGNYPASVSAPPGVQIESAVGVAIGRRGAAHGHYVATAGRIRILRAREGSISGMVYATLRDKAAPKSASLNGTWSCRVDHGG